VSKFVRGAQGTIAKFSKSDAAALTNLAGQLIAMLEDRATEDRAVESAAGPRPGRPGARAPTA
jgi:hypothetical protein